MSTHYPDLLERFIEYVKVYTTSKHDVESIPSTQRQFDLANLLVKQLKEMGVADAIVDEHCIVTGTLPSNLLLKKTDSKKTGKTDKINTLDTSHKIPTICFIAHMDTSPSESGENVKPIVHDYKGGNITLPCEPKIVISPDENPSLKNYIGSKIITSDGTTLLGADDKTGVAEIMTVVSQLTKNPQFQHGKLKIMFTPDEEVGTGVHAVDVKKLDADIAYTLDGSELGELEVECFNAINGFVEIKGYNVHPGYAYGKMVNSVRIIRDILAYFPDNEAPETSKDRDGYYHPTRISGDENSVKLDFLLRDFDREGVENRLKILTEGIELVKKKYPKATIELKIKHIYNNMIEILNQNPIIIEIAEEAMKRAGIVVKRKPIRGGTDGSQLSFKGLPCPNLFSGGINFHSKKEFAPLLVMEKAVETIMNIITISVERFEKKI
jgi:tripeptide aminopeptidase